MLSRGGARGLLIGIALGTLLTGLRVLFGVDRPYGGQLAMADIRCPNCGKNNPDFLDVCQFCQTPLKPESMVHIGEKPTKKNTGELENVLPEWLRDDASAGKRFSRGRCCSSGSPAKGPEE